MGDFKQRQNGSSIVGDSHISDVVNQHLVKTTISSALPRLDTSRKLLEDNAYPTGPRDDLRMFDTVWQAMTVPLAVCHKSTTPADSPLASLTSAPLVLEPPRNRPYA